MPYLFLAAIDKKAKRQNMSLPKNLKELAGRIELTLHRYDLTNSEIKTECVKADQAGLRGVCINTSRISLASTVLENSETKVIGLIGFPTGAQDSDVKRFESEVAIDNGAHEVAVVLNSGLLKDAADQLLLRELRDIVESVDQRHVTLVIEPADITDEQKKLIYNIVLDSGATAIQLGKGLPFNDITADQVKAFRDIVGQEIGVKVGISRVDLDKAIALFDSGADIIVTTSAFDILNEFTSRYEK